MLKKCEENNKINDNCRIKFIETSAAEGNLLTNSESRTLLICLAAQKKNAYCAKAQKMAHPTVKLAMLVIQLSVKFVKALTNP